MTQKPIARVATVLDLHLPEPELCMGTLVDYDSAREDVTLVLSGHLAVVHLWRVYRNGNFLRQNLRKTAVSP
jgi:hypothetical protein